MFMKDAFGGLALSHLQIIKAQRNNGVRVHITNHFVIPKLISHDTFFCFVLAVPEP